MNVLIALLAIATGYLAGSISFARLVTRVFAPRQDITRTTLQVPGSDATFESRAISATSVRLNLGPKYGCLTGILDILKATVPTLAFRLWQPDAPYYLLAAAMAPVGHIWPIYHRFKGGRGMSPIMGGMLIVDWVGVVVTNLLGLLSDLAIKSTLVASGVWLILMIPWLWLRGRDWPELLYAAAMCALFWLSMIPEWREMARLQRQGVLDNLRQAKEVRVLSRLDRGTALRMSTSDLLSALLTRLRRRDGRP